MKTLGFTMLSAAVLSATLSACSNTGAPVGSVPAKVAPIAQVPDTLKPQIVNGVVSAVGSRPYQVAVLNAGRPTSVSCGGTLISANWVMTAAHCVVGNSASSKIVRAGVSNLSNVSEGQTVNVSQIIVHPNYNGNTNSSDIALLKLSQAVTAPNTAPAAIPGNAVEAVLDVNGKTVVASGWGKTESGSVSSQLREVVFPIVVTGNQCGSRPANTICGPADNTGKDTCNGDSGGPLAQTYQGKTYVLGIVSYGPSACRGNGVYTRVNGFAAWIEQTSGVAPDGGSVIPPPPTQPGNTYTGNLTGTRLSSYQPSTSGFNYAGGTLKGALSGPSSASADFDLYLQKLSGSTWNIVARSESPTNTENISYNAASGTYRWRVYSYAGSGSFTLTETK